MNPGICAPCGLGRSRNLCCNRSIGNVGGSLYCKGLGLQAHNNSSNLSVVAARGKLPEEERWGKARGCVTILGALIPGQRQLVWESGRTHCCFLLSLLSPLASQARFGLCVPHSNPAPLHLRVTTSSSSLSSTQIPAQQCCSECGTPCQKQETSRRGFRDEAGRQALVEPPSLAHRQRAFSVQAFTWYLCVILVAPNTSTVPVQPDL